jgi:hypothetical protein
MSNDRPDVRLSAQEASDARELLLELRGRLRLALSKTTEEDRLEFPTVWSLLLMDGGTHPRITGHSLDLVIRLRPLLDHRAQAELEGVFSKADRMRRAVGKAPPDPATWQEIVHMLEDGFARADAMVRDAYAPSVPLPGLGLPGVQEKASNLDRYRSMVDFTTDMSSSVRRSWRSAETSAGCRYST